MEYHRSSRNQSSSSRYAVGLPYSRQHFNSFFRISSGQRAVRKRSVGSAKTQGSSQRSAPRRKAVSSVMALGPCKMPVIRLVRTPILRASSADNGPYSKCRRCLGMLIDHGVGARFHVQTVLSEISFESCVMRQVATCLEVGTAASLRYGTPLARFFCATKNRRDRAKGHRYVDCPVAQYRSRSTSCDPGFICPMIFGPGPGRRAVDVDVFGSTPVSTNVSATSQAANWLEYSPRNQRPVIKMSIIESATDNVNAAHVARRFATFPQ